MNHLFTYRKAVWASFLVIAFVLVGCEMPVPVDELPPTLTPAPTMSVPQVSPTAPPPTVDPLAPTVDPLAPTADPLAPTPVPTVPGVTDATAVPPQSTVPAGTGGAQTIHVVAPGDTLFSISQRYGVSQEAIIAANGLTNPNSLIVGQQLIIPAPGTTPPTPPPGTEQVYTVRPGDNLFRIGLQFGCTVDQMAAHNNIPAPYTIFVGDQIRIPPNC